MEKKGYGRLVKEELRHEAKLQRVKKRCATLIAEAKKEAEARFRTILDDATKEVAQERKLLAQEQQQYLSSLKQQTVTYQKKMQKKREQLPTITASLAQQCIEEWT